MGVVVGMFAGTFGKMIYICGFNVSDGLSQDDDEPGHVDQLRCSNEENRTHRVFGMLGIIRSGAIAADHASLLRGGAELPTC